MADTYVSFFFVLFTLIILISKNGLLFHDCFPLIIGPFLPSGQADLLCCGAFAVNDYGFMRHAVHIDP
jgi:hypothetical protein